MPLLLSSSRRLLLLPSRIFRYHLPRHRGHHGASASSPSCSTPLLYIGHYRSYSSSLKFRQFGLLLQQQQSAIRISLNGKGKRLPPLGSLHYSKFSTNSSTTKHTITIPTTYPYDITIGSTTRSVLSPPRSPHLVPNNYHRERLFSRGLLNTDLAHLEWMMRKEALGQDVFLIGPPGGYKRRLVGLYASLFQREVEVLQISRDSTEADIKQIREIRGKSVVYYDQAAVRTALNGHILVLDGIEKAERNVLPVLNNLLENREMHLDDGRHLIPHYRFDRLVKEHGIDVVKSWGLERVHPDFRVIAIGVPVPTFKGNPLDPPLRSRFQARNVGSGYGREEVVERVLLANGEAVGGKTRDGIEKMVDLAFGINYMNSRDFKERLGGGVLVPGDGRRRGVVENDTRVGEDLPWFVVDSLFDGVEIFKNISKSGLGTFTSTSELLPHIFRLMYPYSSNKVDQLITEQLGMGKGLKKLKNVPKDVLRRLKDPAPLESQMQVLSMLYEFLKLDSGSSSRAALLYGPQGCGKSVVAGYVGEMLKEKKDVVTVQVFKDMSTRDLFQVRGTVDGKKGGGSGDTIWRKSALVEVAERGGVCILDGVENLDQSVFGVLGGFVREGEVLMPDGVSLLVRRRGDDNKKGEEEVMLREKNSRGEVIWVHPDFRLIGVGDSSDLELTPEVCSVFMVFGVGMGEEDEIKVCGGGEEVRKVLRVLRELRRRGKEGDKACAALSRSLSVAQVKRIGQRVERRKGRDGEGEDDPMLLTDLWNAVCGQFLPLMEKEVFLEVLKAEGIVRDKKKVQEQRKRKEVVVEGKKWKIGDVGGDVAEEAGEFSAKIPKGGVFFDIEQHVGMLERLADDFVNGGDHLLVVGNQGVGKNKIVDRLLEVMGRGREYVQLHRDTTVQSLTTNQKIEGGVIKVEDSPLVKAARNGLVLVVDEADKAPAHVTAVLKGLAERGEMVLGDGRRMVKSRGNETINDDGGKVIPVHPEFRMMVLANRPGFPFLGNSFYGSLSHLFGVHPVENPGVKSEVELLSGYYGGDEKEKGAMLENVAKVFGELRKLSDEGVLAYPYSTREAVHVVKHLGRYPGDVKGALGNVFDFDWWNEESWGVVKRVVEGGLGVGVMRGSEEGEDRRNPIALKIVERSEEEMLKKKGGEGGESHRKDFSRFGDPKTGKFDATGAAHVGGNQWAGGSGGMSTAGLGGAGGPYRLTDGNPVFQVSAEAKASVPPEVLQKARELNRKMFEEKLKELKMSRYDSNVYNEFLNPILPHIHALRNVLESLQAKAEERKWVKHQTSGDLDDGKLVEGLIGEENVYRGRMEKRPEVGDPLVKPKLLRLLVDLSGSMYRFNGYDGRLERVVSCVLMMMEGFKKKGGGGSDRIEYEIYGHSGDEDNWEIVGKRNRETLGTDERERFMVVKEMWLHSQFCSSGDNTVEATVRSMEGLGKRRIDYDEVVLVVLSDANFERYGISVKEFGKVLMGGKIGGGSSSTGDKVEGYSIFIGSLGDQAERLKNELPSGRGYVCMDVGELPSILQRIFREGVLK